MSAPPRAQVPPPLITRSFLLLVAAHFLTSLGYSSLLLLPLYLQHLGADREEIGVIMATAAVSGILTRPAVAWMLDRWGRKPVVVMGTAITGVSMLMLAAVVRIDMIIYLERAILGAGLGAVFTGYFTFAADIVPQERRTEGLALFGASGLVPLLINPFADQIGISVPGLRWFLPAIGILILLSLLILWRIPEPESVAGSRPPMRRALGALVHASLWPVWLATITFGGLVALFMTFATVAAEERGVENAPSLWLTYALGAVLVRLLGGRVPDRLGPSNLVAPAIGLYVGALLLAAMAHDFGDFLVAATMAGVGHGYCFPVLSGQVVSRMPATFRGSGVALFTALWGVSELLITPLFGAIADARGDAAMFVLAACAAVVCLLIWAALEHLVGHRPQSPPPDS